MSDASHKGVFDNVSLELRCATLRRSTETISCLPFMSSVKCFLIVIDGF